MKITGIKKAVGDYNRANAEGAYSPRYGIIMLDRSSGEVWTDEFYDLGHNSFKNYDSPAIINLSYRIREMEEAVNMQNVKEFAEVAIAKYNK